VQEAGQPGPTRERIADRLGQCCGRRFAQAVLPTRRARRPRQPSIGSAAPRADGATTGRAPPLRSRKARRSGAALLLRSALRSLVGRHRTCVVCAPNRVALGRELFEAGIAIDMQHALEVLKVRYRALGLSVRREQVDRRWRLGSSPWPLLSRIDPQSPVFVRPRPGSSTGTGVSSANR
jgi:hypothetical protein